MGYFEFAEADASMFSAVMAALRDAEQNPEWAYISEGPEWWGRKGWETRGTLGKCNNPQPRWVCLPFHLCYRAYKPPGIFFQDSLYLGSGEGEAVDVVGFGFRAGQRVVGAQADFVCLLLADDG